MYRILIHPLVITRILALRPNLLHFRFVNRVSVYDMSEVVSQFMDHVSVAFTNRWAFRSRAEQDGFQNWIAYAQMDLITTLHCRNSVK